MKIKQKKPRNVSRHAWMKHLRINAKRGIVR